MAFLLKELS